MAVYTNLFTVSIFAHYKKYIYSLTNVDDGFYVSISCGVRKYYSTIRSEITSNETGYGTTPAPYNDMVSYKYKSKNYGYSGTLTFGWDILLGTVFMSINYQHVSIDKFTSGGKTLRYNDGRVVSLTANPITVTIGGGVTY